MRYASVSTSSSGFSATSQNFSTTIRSCVSVPVLSVQRTSIAPKFWIEASRLTTTFLRDMAIAPFDRQTATIIGSISGVMPTATAIAKKNAPVQSALVSPLMRKTVGTMTRMK